MEKINSAVESTADFTQQEIVNFINELLKKHSLTLSSDHVIKVMPIKNEAVAEETKPNE